MKVINLEKYNSHKRINIPGAGEFTVTLFTVGDFIEGKGDHILPSDGDGISSVKAMVDFIAEYSDIPRDVILKQGSGMLTALCTIIQGGEIRDESEGGNPNA